VAITASYVQLLLDPKKGELSLAKWLHADNPDWRRLASAALAVSGKYGIALSIKTLKESTDPYVTANVALGLIGQRVYLKDSARILYDMLCSNKSNLWMWETHYNPL